MAVEAVASRGVGIALACRAFDISESCYRYDRKLSDENAEISEWLVKLTTYPSPRHMSGKLAPTRCSKGISAHALKY
jgi:hypothetical protein